jgi:hypothetical protein
VNPVGPQVDIVTPKRSRAMKARGTSRPCGQDRRREPLPLAGFQVRPLVVHPRRFHLHRTRAGHHRARLVVAMAVHQLTTVLVDLVGELLHIRRHLGLQDSSPRWTTLSMGTCLPARRWRVRLDQTCESDHPGRYALPDHPQVLIIAPAELEASTGVALLDTGGVGGGRTLAHEVTSCYLSDVQLSED